jgi:phosphate transport system substrate-binding protein
MITSAAAESIKSKTVDNAIFALFTQILVSCLIGHGRIRLSTTPFWIPMKTCIIEPMHGIQKIWRGVALLSGCRELARRWLFLPTIICFTFSDSVLAQEVIEVGGTGTGTLLIRHLSDSYSKLHPEVRVNAIMPPMGSNGSLRALTAGAIQIAIVTFPTVYPAPAKTEDAEPNKVVPWVRTPLIFTGHDIGSTTRLSLAQVTDIYSGRLTQWPDSKQIRLITRTERESDTRILRAISQEMDAAVMASVGRIGMPFAENDLDNQQLLERTAGSFGAIGLGQLLLSGSTLKPASLDGILPSADNLQNDTYWIEKPLYLVTNKASSPASLEFIKYLKSPDVVKRIRRFGFIPLKHD